MTQPSEHVLAAPNWSFRELDRAAGRPKGSAFRAFKRCRRGLCENRDFAVLEGADAAAQVESLRAAGRVYASTVNAVLLGAFACRAVCAELGVPPPAAARDRAQSATDHPDAAL